jgi:hypothetical protein
VDDPSILFVRGKPDARQLLYFIVNPFHGIAMHEPFGRELGACRTERQNAK